MSVDGAVSSDEPKDAGQLPWHVIAMLALLLLAIPGTMIYFSMGPSWETCAKEAVLKKLRDPSSAKFEEVTSFADQSGGHVYGFVNSKNGFGGYSGRTRFSVDLDQACVPKDVFVSELTEIDIDRMADGLK